MERERETLKREWFRQIKEKDTMTANLAFLMLALDGDGMIYGLSPADAREAERSERPEPEAPRRRRR